MSTVKRAATGAGGDCAVGPRSRGAGRRPGHRCRRLGRAEVAELGLGLLLPRCPRRRRRRRPVPVGAGRRVAWPPVPVARAGPAAGSAPLPAGRRRRLSSPTRLSDTLPCGSMSSTRTSTSSPRSTTSSTLLDPLAAAELGDVEQAVTAREDVDEGAELGDVDDLALVDGADLGLGRVEDQLDAAAGLRRPPRRPWPRW